MTADTGKLDGPAVADADCDCNVRPGGLRFCCDSLPGYPHDLEHCTASPAMRDAMADHDEMFHDGPKG